MPRHPGRQTNYNAIRAAKVIEGLKAGMTRTGAIGLVNMSRTTIQRWCERYPSFNAQVEAAEAEAEARYTQVIARSAFGYDVTQVTVTEDPAGGRTTITKTWREYDWQAAKFWLTKRRREEWGDSLHIDLDVEITTLIREIMGERRVVISNEHPEQLADLGRTRENPTEE